MKNQKSLLYSLTPEQRQRLIDLIMEIRGEIQYFILIIAKHPNAEVVREVRKILSNDKSEKESTT